jgi:hypothetical protein
MPSRIAVKFRFAATDKLNFNFFWDADVSVVAFLVSEHAHEFNIDVRPMLIVANTGEVRCHVKSSQKKNRIARAGFILLDRAEQFFKVPRIIFAGEKGQPSFSQINDVPFHITTLILLDP